MTDRKEYNKAWRLSHPNFRTKWNSAHPNYYIERAKKNKEQRKEYNKKYHIKNKKKTNEWSRNYYLLHKEKLNEGKKKWREAHPVQTREQKKKHYLANKEEICKKARKWEKEHPEAVKRFKRAGNAKRRQFGFVLLNKYFPGSHGHHIDLERIIYIPKELHRSIRHSVTLNVNMEKINEAAFNFLNGGE